MTFPVPITSLINRTAQRSSDCDAPSLLDTLTILFTDF